MDIQDQISRLKGRIIELEQYGESDLLRTVREKLAKLTAQQTTYPVTFVWQAAPWIAAVARQWQRAPGGNIETTFTDRAELEAAVWVMQTLR